jgi:hypothetical protein
MNSMSSKTARSVFDLLNTASDPHSTSTSEDPDRASGTAATSTARAGSGKVPGITENAVASVISTLAARSAPLDTNNLLTSYSLSCAKSFTLLSLSLMVQVLKSDRRLWT